MRRSATALCCFVFLVAGCTAHRDGPAAAKPSPTATKGVDNLPSAGPFPSVLGTFGTKPKLAFETSQKPSAQLQRRVIAEGTGPIVATGDLIAVDYLGQIWHGNVFDNTYDRQVATTVQIGIGSVIAGWDKGLVGLKVGSRVELSVPPAMGYGTKGDPASKITPTDTLVFVVDIGRRYNARSTADPNATLLPQPATIPKVLGALTSGPNIEVAKTSRPPGKKATYLLARGSGAVLKQGTAVIQYTAVNWAGEVVGSTWQNGTATSVPIGGDAGTTGGLFDTLAGFRIGSRVLVTAPAPPGESATENSVAVVIDLIDQVTTAKSMASANS